MTREPLDIDETRKQKEEKEPYSRVRFYLELVPLMLLGVGVLMQYQGSMYWKYPLIVGGGLAAIIYLLFSRFLFKAEKQKTYEVFLSIASGLVITTGILGLLFQEMFWDGGEEMIRYSLYGALLLIFATLISFIVYIKNQQAARFHRGLLARMLIFVAIVLSLSI